MIGLKELVKMELSTPAKMLVEVSRIVMYNNVVIKNRTEEMIDNADLNFTVISLDGLNKMSPNQLNDKREYLQNKNIIFTDEVKL